MKSFFSKTFRVGKLTVSIFWNEIVIVYVGKRKIYFKTIRIKRPSDYLKRLREARPSLPRIPVPRINIIYHQPLTKRSKRLVFALTGSLVAITLFFSLYPARREEQAPVDDETIKRNLLQSKATDYSSPEKMRIVIREHRVKEGETLQKIAKKFGVSVDTIRGTNNMTADSPLRLGMLLKIPNRDGLLLKMQKGGSLVAIANRYRVSLKKIIDENNLKNPDFVAANTVLFIPDAKPLNIFSGFLWPGGTKSVTCGYGWRRNPFDPRYTEFHPGIDIRSNFQSVRASKYGQVTFTGWLGGYGKTVVIAHPGGWKTLYGHLSHILVRTGQYVKQGQQIAVSGNTGRSTGAHLHFEILKNNVNINPYIYFRKKQR